MLLWALSKTSFSENTIIGRPETLVTWCGRVRRGVVYVRFFLLVAFARVREGGMEFYAAWSPRPNSKSGWCGKYFQPGLTLIARDGWTKNCPWTQSLWIGGCTELTSTKMLGTDKGSLWKICGYSSSGEILTLAKTTRSRQRLVSFFPLWLWSKIDGWKKEENENGGECMIGARLDVSLWVSTKSVLCTGQTGLEEKESCADGSTTQNLCSDFGWPGMDLWAYFSGSRKQNAVASGVRHWGALCSAVVFSLFSAPTALATTSRKHHDGSRKRLRRKGTASLPKQPIWQLKPWTRHWKSDANDQNKWVGYNRQWAERW